MSDKKKKSILLVEKNEDVLNDLISRFRKRDMFVISAKDGYEGYTRACNESPDFIVTEVLLPSMNGFRLSRLLKFDDRYKHIRIILVTTNDTNSSKDMFAASGADHILRKPFRFSELIDAVKIEAMV